MILCSLLNVDIIPGVRPDRKKIVALLLFGLVVPAGLRIIGTTYSRSGASTSPNGKGSYGTDFLNTVRIVSNASLEEML
jgi:hypothetical protein